MRPLALDRPAAIDWYLRNRARSRAIFDLIEPSAYYSRPIALRNPIVFYEGHLPAFSIISLMRRGLDAPPVDARLETLFERGIDPDSAESAVPRSGSSTAWPARSEVLEFASRADAAILDALERADDSSSRRTEALYTALEHEVMHQETLLYMWHRLPYDQKRKPDGLNYELVLPPPPQRAQKRAPGAPAEGGSHEYLNETEGGSHEYVKVTELDTPAEGGRASDHTDKNLWLPPSGGRTSRSVRIPAGTATLGAGRDRVTFGWDNEFDEHRVEVAAFDIDVHAVTNGDFLAFVLDGGYRNQTFWSAEAWEWVQQDGIEVPAFWVKRGRELFWRGMFEEIPLPHAWPVYVSHAEASAYARWKGRRLPTEAEFHRAAFGTPSGTERAYPWGDAPPDRTRGNVDFQAWEPVPAGSRPAGASAWGVHDLVGNGWEWTSTVFGPFDGFSPMASYPEYSADFFDGQHYVMKGGSPATATELLRRSFRNWFRPNYPYVYAKFRTVT